MELTERQKKELEAIRNLPDELIDMSDAPEVLDWSNARRGVLYQPVKQETTLTLDEYVIDWFRRNEPDEQARYEVINQILMEYIRVKTFPGTRTQEPGKPEKTT